MAADLDVAVDASRAALEAAPARHPDRAGMASNLGSALAIRFGRTGVLADLDAAVDAIRAAVNATTTDHHGRAAMLSNLGSALRIRFERTGVPVDLDAAVEVARAAVEATPDDHPGRAGYLSNLGSALAIRFGRTGVPADLDAAVDASRAAVAATRTSHPDRARYLSNLGNALQARFERSGMLADLDAAVEVGREAVAATPTGHPDRARYLSNLGAALRIRFERAGALADLDAAVEVGGAAVDATPTGHPDRVRRLANLGTALQTRFERTGMLADLDAAVEVDREAVAATPTGHPDRAAMMSNLGTALRNRFEWTGVRADIDAAVDASQEAVEATPAGHPGRARYLSNLGNTMTTRFQRTGAPADLDAAVDAGREAFGVGLASVRVRATAARVWGRAAAVGGRWGQAVAGYAASAGLLGELAPRELARPDQEGLLADVGGLGADAAACAVRAGDPGRAVELFEQGRGVLLGQALDTRGDLSRLERDHPELHGRFVALAAELDQPHTADVLTAPDMPTGGGPDDRELLVQRRRKLRAEFDGLIVQVRRHGGFGGFLRPVPLVELTPAAADGPVVIVAVSWFGSYALVLTPDGVADPVELDALTPLAAAEEVRAFAAALGRLSSPETAPDAHKAARDRLSATLVWLWDQLAGPILDHLDTLGLLATQDGDRPPRVWWCLSGPLAFLPVHAAGHHDTRSARHPQTVIDRVVSSYTPTVRALAHARSHAGDTASPAGADGWTVAVAMPHTPGQLDLPGAHREVDQLERRFPGRVRVLTGRQATRDGVLAALPGARRAHFACHGSANLADPSASRLLLHDHQTKPLTVIDVARLRLDDAELAFLSACETARPGTRLTDEVIHLTSAFQLAGYRHVVGTLWPIGDEDAVDFADRVYTEVAATGDVARGVHAATRQLRSRRPDDPSVWASHVHVGA
jgi:predicted metal-dependent phosphoesterase TrpH